MKLLEAALTLTRDRIGLVRVGAGSAAAASFWRKDARTPRRRDSARPTGLGPSTERRPVVASVTECAMAKLMYQPPEADHRTRRLPRADRRRQHPRDAGSSAPLLICCQVSYVGAITARASVCPNM